MISDSTDRTSLQRATGRTGLFKKLGYGLSKNTVRPKFAIEKRSMNQTVQ